MRSRHTLPAYRTAPQEFPSAVIGGILRDMITLTNPPSAAVRDCLFAFELFRRIGFTAEQIFAGIVPVPPRGQLVTAAVLKHEDKEFVWTLRATHHTEASFKSEWLEATAVWNAAPPTQDVWGFTRSEVFGMRMNVVRAIASKGIPLPALVN
jgi:hypothetical protein